MFLSLLVLILAFSLVLVAIEFYNLSVVNYSNQAKLLLASDLARSGALTLFEWLRKNPSKLGELFQEGTTKRFSARFDGVSHELSYETTKSGPLYTIKCTATVGGFKRSRAIVFKVTGGGFRHTVVSLGKLEINNNAKVYGDVFYLGTQKLIISNSAEIHGSVYITKENITDFNISGDSDRVKIFGNVYAKGNIKNFHNVKVDGSIYCGGTVKESGNNSYQVKYENLPNIDDYFRDLPTSFPMPRLPEGNYATLSEGDYIVGDKSTINANTRYYGRVGGSLKVQGNAELIFETNGYDMFIKIDGAEFNVDGSSKIMITGGGTVWIYAKKVTFSQYSKLILKGNSNVVFFSDEVDGGEFTFSNEVELKGNGGVFIYAPGKAVKFSNQASAKPIKGAIIAKEVHLSNNTCFLPSETNVSLGQIVSGVNPDLQIERWE